MTSRPSPVASVNPYTGIVDLHDDDGSYDLDAVLAGGVSAIIHKITEGGDFADPDDQRSIERIARDGRFLLGLYHYANARDPVVQADHFVRHASYFPNALLALDVEDNSRSRFGTMNAGQAAVFVRRVHEKTGRWPLFYSFTSFMKNMRASRLPEADRYSLSRCPLWQAQYGERPSRPACDIWSRIDLWQYTNGADGPRNRVVYPRSTQGFKRAAQDRSAFFGGEAELRDAWSKWGRSDGVTPGET